MARLNATVPVILIAVRWYLRYGLSYRDLEELLAERGIEVDHVTLFRWVQRFTPLLIDAARPCRHSVGGHWFVDETYVKVSGSWRYVYRAVDQYGQVIDDPERRRIRGVAAQSVLVAFQLFAANLRKIDQYFTRMAADAKKFRKRPSRRRTRSLRTWTPETASTIDPGDATSDPDPPLTA